MPTVLIGDGPLLETLKTQLTEKAWRVPAGGTAAQQATFLARGVPAGRKGVAFTDQPADWASASRAGWTVYWCSPGQVPLGTQPVPTELLARSMSDLTRRFWGVETDDRRLVGEVMLGNTRQVGTVLPVTSVTGGVGKTLSCRRFAERASQQHVRTLLVDANMRQSSQRHFFDPRGTMRVRTVLDWRGGDPRMGANPGKHFGIRYDLAFAPPTGQTVGWDHYRAYIDAARMYWNLIVVDLDRISAADLTQDDTAASTIVAHYARAGQPTLFIVKAGRQTQADAMTLISRLPECGLPRETVGVKDTLAIGVDGYDRYDYSRFATFLGTERQSHKAEEHIAKGESGWADPGLDPVRERVLAWAMPDAGFDPGRYPDDGKRRRKGLFG